MKKRTLFSIILFGLFLLFVACIIFVCCNKKDGDKDNQPQNFGIVCRYLPEEDAYEVISLGSEKEVEIPSTWSTEEFGEHPIIGIAKAETNNCTTLSMTDSIKYISNFAFADSTKLETIKFSNSLETIGDSAFKQCYYLNNLTIPETVQKIRMGAFESCRSISTIKLNEGLTVIKANTFKNCFGLKQISLPNSVTTIEENAFYFCEYLKTITFSSSLTEIKDCAFIGCYNLELSELPEGLKVLGARVFANCLKIYSITLPSSITNPSDSWNNDMLHLVQIFDNTPSRCMQNKDFDKDTTKEVVFAGQSSLGQITKLENNGECYTYWNYLGSKYLLDYDTNQTSDVSLTITEKVYFYALYMTTPLVSLTIKSSEIGQSAFGNCRNLTTVTISSEASLTEIPKYAFGYSKSLVNLNINCNTIKSISEYAFDKCSSLVEVNLPDSLESLSYGAFSDCTSLTKIKFGTKVKSVDYIAFQNCENIREITISNQYMVGQLGKLSTIKSKIVDIFDIIAIKNELVISGADYLNDCRFIELNDGYKYFQKTNA